MKPAFLSLSTYQTYKISPIELIEVTGEIFLFHDRHWNYANVFGLTIQDEYLEYGMVSNTKE